MDSNDILTRYGGTADNDLNHILKLLEEDESEDILLSPIRR